MTCGFCGGRPVYSCEGAKYDTVKIVCPRCKGNPTVAIPVEPIIPMYPDKPSIWQVRVIVVQDNTLITSMPANVPEFASELDAIEYATQVTINSPRSITERTPKMPVSHAEFYPYPSTPPLAEVTYLIGSLTGAELSDKACMIHAASNVILYGTSQMFPDVDGAAPASVGAGPCLIYTNAEKVELLTKFVESCKPRAAADTKIVIPWAALIAIAMQILSQWLPH